MNIIMPGGGGAGGDRCPDGEQEESELSLETAAEAPPGGAGERRRQTKSSGGRRERGGGKEKELRMRRRSGGQREGGEESGASGGEVGQDDEEEMMMTSGGSQHDLSSSPRSTTGSISTSTSKSEHADASRGHSRREMMTTVAEMKKRVPSDKRSSRSKAARTVDALQYALNCVKQVQANSEYYKLLMSKGQEERRDTSVCTLVELERVTSEHTLKNTDSFVVAFSLASGRVLYASEQAPSILCCKRKFLESAKFVELLFHQDVNVFYSHTAQPHLPPWSSSPTAAVLFECAQVKSFFCRIRGGKDREGEMRYNPFRITPYLLKVQGTGASGTEESCCLALAERIISGYEAPRIPMDKRIFTTTHSPGSVFLEVDDRAVPLLGYLPQDLIGTSLLTCVHPEDRPLMLSVHKKVLKYAGQSPFEHSPVRLRCQNGDYVTLDTSWSSFINPWSRKVAFVIGRHKVRTSPLNEDVFAARSKDDLPTTHEEIKTLQAKIYKLFLQPVTNNGSSGYGSLGSNGSHEHYTGVASSSDSNGNLWEDSHREPMTLQQICADVNRVKSWGQQAYLDSRNKLIPLGKPATAAPPPTACNANVRGHNKEGRKQAHIPSYQQINCVDNIIKFLDGCTAPDLKRKNECRSQATSSSSSSSTTSEDDKPTGATHTAQAASDEVVLDIQVSVDTSTAAAVVGVRAPLTDITMSTKAMSMVSLPSQCSYSSTIVHVPQPESEVTALEDAPMGSEPTDPPSVAAPPPQTPPAVRPAPTQHSPTHSSATEEELLLMTKEVLSAHTEKEEQEYVDRFRHRILQSPYSSYLQQDSISMAHSHHPGDTVMRPLSAAPAAGGGGWNRPRTGGKPKHKRAKPQLQDSSDSYGASPPDPPSPMRSGSRPPPPPHSSSWPPSSESSSHPQVGGGGAPVLYNSQMNPPPLLQQTPYPPIPMMTTGFEQQITGMAPMVFGDQTQTQTGFNFNLMQPDPSSMQSVMHLQSFQIQNIQNFPSIVAPPPPVAALQACINPYAAAAAAAPVMAVILPNYPTTTTFAPGYHHHHPSSIFPPPAVNPMMMPQPQVPFTTMAGFAPGAAAPFLQAQFQAQPGPPPPLQHHQAPQTPLVGPLFHGEEEEEEEEEEEVGAGAGPPALFSSSRSSSPLQLNLLQEELPSRPSEGGAFNHLLMADSLHEQHHGAGGDDDAPCSDSGRNHHDAQSTSSELLDLMLQEDARSGTGSNASGSGSSGESLGRSLGSSGSGSGSNGTSTSHTGSSNSSKYFASNDSSDTSRKARKSQQQQQEATAEHHHQQQQQQHAFEPCVENPLWTMIQHTPDPVMMNYQIHARDQEEVLAEDREKLRVLEPLQPWFNQNQRRELAQVHPWIRQHGIPPEIDTQGCVGCNNTGSGMMMTGHSSSPLPPPPPPAPDSSSPMESPSQRDDPHDEDPCPLQDT